MTLRYTIDIELRGEEMIAFSKYRDRIGSTYEGVFIHMIREFLMADKAIKEEDIIYSQNIEDRLGNLENKLVDASTRYHYQTEKIEKLEGQISILTEYIEDIQSEMDF